MVGKDQVTTEATEIDWAQVRKWTDLTLEVRTAIRKAYSGRAHDLCGTIHSPLDPCPVKLGYFPPR